MTRPSSASTGLFVLFEGASSTIFTSQVIEHIRFMQRLNVFMPVLTFEPFRKNWVLSQSNKKRLANTAPEIRVHLKRCVNLYWPGSSLFNALILLWHLRIHHQKIEFIHSRADYSTFLSLITKPLHRKRVLWDCRGDSYDELLKAVSRQKWFIRISLGPILKVRQKLIVFVNRRMCDAAVFVSDELRAIHEKHLRCSPVGVIPCLVPEDKFLFDRSLRATSRRDLGLADTDRVYIYSGSAVPYQGLDEFRDSYSRILSCQTNRIILLTKDARDANSVFSDMLGPRFQIISAEYEEMNAYYNAADFALMIRSADPLNWVASPTKFGEYCMAGLPVIQNDTIGQVISICKRLGTYNHISSIGSENRLSDERREEVARNASKIFSRIERRQDAISLYQSAFGVRGSRKSEL